MLIKDQESGSCTPASNPLRRYWCCCSWYSICLSNFCSMLHCWRYLRLTSKMITCRNTGKQNPSFVQRQRMGQLCGYLLIWTLALSFPATKVRVRDSWWTANMAKAVWFKFSATSLWRLHRVTPGLTDLLLFSFRSRTPKQHCPSVPSCVLQFSVCPCGQAAFLLMFFLIMFYNKVKELCILALIGRVAQPHCCKLLWIRVIPMLIVFSLLHWLFK